MNEYVKVLTNSSIIINRIASLLNQKNIQTLIKNNFESARLAGFGAPQNEIELYVINSEFENAKKIITDFKKENKL